MLIKVTAMCDINTPQTIAQFTTLRGFNQWLDCPNLPTRYSQHKWCYDDLSHVLTHGASAILGGAFSHNCYGRMWDLFHVEVML